MLKLKMARCSAAYLALLLLMSGEHAVLRCNVLTHNTRHVQLTPLVFMLSTGSESVWCVYGESAEAIHAADCSLPNAHAACPIIPPGQRHVGYIQ